MVSVVWWSWPNLAKLRHYLIILLSSFRTNEIFLVNLGIFFIVILFGLAHIKCEGWCIMEKPFIITNAPESESTHIFRCNSVITLRNSEIHQLWCHCSGWREFLAQCVKYYLLWNDSVLCDQVCSNINPEEKKNESIKCNYHNSQEPNMTYSWILFCWTNIYSWQIIESSHLRLFLLDSY